MQKLQETQVQSLVQEDPLEEGMGNPLQYSCLENPMERGAWKATVLEVAKESDMTEQLSTHRHTHTHTHFLVIIIGRRGASGILLGLDQGRC